MSGRAWSDAEIERLRADYAGVPTTELARALGRSYFAVRMKATTLGLCKSLGTRFEKGCVPWNKGRVGYQAGGRSAETHFRPGMRNGRAAKLWVPVGSYRIVADGILQQKVADTPGPYTLRWKPVHRLVWERAHGSVPRGHVVAFRQGRKTVDPGRITLDALELVSRRELMRRNSVQRYGRDIARLMQLRGALVRQIREREGKT